MTELSKGEGRVEGRSRTGKLREICLMKVNEPGLQGEGYTRGERERAKSLSKQINNKCDGVEEAILWPHSNATGQGS